MTEASLITRLDHAKSFILSRCPDFPKLVLVLGSGLGSFADDIKVEVDMSYADIPHFRSLSVEGHAGSLRIGSFEGVRIACMQGRLHFYEGYPAEDVIFPTRALGWSGGRVFILTNASGGLKSDMAPLDFLLIRDHINMTGTNPLSGKNCPQLGPRFPDLSRLYDPKLSEIIARAAERISVPLRQGVYGLTNGPSYETPAEIRMFRMLGADVVGMSTVFEAISLHHMGRRVVGLSCITNLAAGVTSEVLQHADVLANAKKISTRFKMLMKEAIAEIGGELD